jgi:hypothetical protein
MSLRPGKKADVPVDESVPKARPLFDDDEEDGFFEPGAATVTPSVGLDADAPPDDQVVARPAAAAQREFFFLFRLWSLVLDG